MKQEIRIVGIDDASFNRFKDKTVLIVGTIYRGGNYMDGLVSTRVSVDGDDATDALAVMVRRSKFYPSIRFIMLKGIAVAGLNVIDIKRLNELTEIPVIVVMRRVPDEARIRNILKKLQMDHKIKYLENAGIPLRVGRMLIQFAGTSLNDAMRVLSISATHSNIPESLRIAHIIAGGIVRGQSRGKA